MVIDHQVPRPDHSIGLTEIAACSGRGRSQRGRPFDEINQGFGDLEGGVGIRTALRVAGRACRGAGSASLSDKMVTLVDRLTWWTSAG
jgi:hypothetical protein